MKNIKWIVVVALSATIFSACDTREDIFQESIGNVIVVATTEDGRRDTLSPSSAPQNLKVNYDIHLNKVGWDGSDFKIWSDTVNFSLASYVEEKNAHTQICWCYDKYYTFCVMDTLDGMPYISTIKPCGLVLGDISSQSDVISLYANTFFAYSRRLYGFGWANYQVHNHLFASDTAPALISKTMMVVDLNLGLYDKRNLYFTASLWGDCPPMPVLEVGAVDGHPMERVLSMAKSYDKDGFVQKYEFCIDGNIAPYNVQSPRFEEIEGVWQSGKAAYGGTYIVATALSEVRHAFQSEGEHTIYYRCMDNAGGWSTWREEIIIINK